MTKHTCHNFACNQCFLNFDLQYEHNYGLDMDWYIIAFFKKADHPWTSQWFASISLYFSCKFFNFQFFAILQVKSYLSYVLETSKKSNTILSWNPLISRQIYTCAFQLPNWTNLKDMHIKSLENMNTPYSNVIFKWIGLGRLD